MLVLSSCSTSVVFDDVVLVYCPSMSVHLEEVDFEGLSLLEVQSTAEALSLVSSGGADIAFVGRLSYPFELPADFKEKVLFDRFTIVSSSRGEIDFLDLMEQEIVSFVPVEELKDFDFLNLVS